MLSTESYDMHVVYISVTSSNKYCLNKTYNSLHKKVYYCGPVIKITAYGLLTKSYRPPKKSNLFITLYVFVFCMNS